LYPAKKVSANFLSILIPEQLLVSLALEDFISLYVCMDIVNSYLRAFGDPSAPSAVSVRCCINGQVRVLGQEDREVIFKLYPGQPA